MKGALHVYRLGLDHSGLVDYSKTLQAMQEFTRTRTAQSFDEIWIVEHPAVYTLGLNGKTAHVLDAQDIPLLKTDRGGQVTYHGPGQLVFYFLIDLQRRSQGVKWLVQVMENAVIALLADQGITASARKDAPGVYVDDAKIAALGLRIKKGCSYHGLSLNVDMDLQPFCGINPCGYVAQAVTQLKNLGIMFDKKQVQQVMIEKIALGLGHTQIHSQESKNWYARYEHIFNANVEQNNEIQSITVQNETLQNIRYATN